MNFNGVWPSGLGRQHGVLETFRGFESRHPDQTMNLIEIKCSSCSKGFLRPAGRVNEVKKFGWSQYCSRECQNQAKTTSVEKVCANPNCNKKIFRLLNQFKKSKSGYVFCSAFCAAIINNSLRRKIKTCPTCNKRFYGQRKYCSKTCRSSIFKSVIKVPKSQIITEIKKFYEHEGRIPLKREYGHNKAARLRFSTWNKAIEAAGFEPNPVMFAKKYIANDGHKCNSLTEKIIDDWLYARKIKHRREVPYPGSKSLTADFVIGNEWIEFFGLSGVISKYDKLVKKKRILSKKYKLSLIEIYPKDLFPVNRLSEIIKSKKT